MPSRLIVSRELADLLKLLAHADRLRLIEELRLGEKDVTSLAIALQLPATRVSQHLALTPQLQQSIRLLQLSTLELSQEVEQMLDENPFLELDAESEQAEREAHGLEQSDAPVSLGDQVSETADLPSAPPGASSSASSGATAEPEAATGPAAESGAEGGDEIGQLEAGWDGDGTVEISPDDGEWGGEAPARQSSGGDEEGASAIDLASEHVSLSAHLHQQSLSLRLNDEERAALYFLIESLDEDGYLADPLPELAEARIVHMENNLRPALPDNEPHTHAEPGLLRINGLFRHGWLLAPALVQDALAALADMEKEPAHA